MFFTKESKKGKKMKKVVMMAAMAAAMMAAAQPLTPANGVANDHTGNIGGATGVVFAPRTTETGYGYVDGMTVIGFTFLPWAVPNHSWDVTGVRLNLGWGAYRDTAGFDFGVFSANRNADGLFINWCGTYATGDSHGWQNGLVNVVSHRMCGLQIGLVNYADRLDGVQIGLLNFARSQWFFPFINIGW